MMKYGEKVEKLITKKVQQSFKSRATYIIVACLTKQSKLQAETSYP